MIEALRRIRASIFRTDDTFDYSTTPLRRAACLAISPAKIIEQEVYADIIGMPVNVPLVVRHLATHLISVEKVAMFYGYSIPELLELAAENL